MTNAERSRETEKKRRKLVADFSKLPLPSVREMLASHENALFTYEYKSQLNRSKLRKEEQKEEQIETFMDKLDKEFTKWEKIEKTNEGKKSNTSSAEVSKVKKTKPAVKKLQFKVSKNGKIY